MVDDPGSAAVGEEKVVSACIFPVFVIESVFGRPRHERVFIDHFRVRVGADDLGAAVEVLRARKKDIFRVVPLVDNIIDDLVVCQKERETGKQHDAGQENKEEEDDGVALVLLDIVFCNKV